MDASVEVMPEDGCYQMVCYGTLQSSGAYKVMAKRRGYQEEEIKEFGKKLGEIEKIKDKEKHHLQYAEMLEDEVFGDILKESEKFLDVIDSISPSPCSSLLWDQPISRKLGLRKVGTEKTGYVICCNIDGYTSDVWKFLKNDLLTATVWDLVALSWKEIGKPIPTIPEMRKLITDDVWRLYRDGITKTLNQADTNYATPLVQKYSPTSVAELTAWVAGIRPAFASLLDGFLNRIEYTTGTPQLDKLLESSFCYMLYQENIMAYLSWLGIEKSGTYDIVKKISKKKFTEEELETLKETLKLGWIKNVGSDDGFDSTWQVMYDASDYAFNSSHALSVAWDSVYGAYLKVTYPLIYYTVVFNHKKYEKAKVVARIVPELEYFGITQKPIKFRYSQGGYSRDESTNSIYKGIASIKFLNYTISDQLYKLRDSKYNSFIDLLIDINENTGVDSRHLRILTELDFFTEFGQSQKLKDITKIFDDIYSRKQFKKAELASSNIPEHLVKMLSKNETEKLYKEVNTKRLVEILCEDIEDRSIKLKERLESELENLGYLNYIYPDANCDLYYVLELKLYASSSYKPYLQLYRIQTGEIIRAKITNGKFFASNQFKEKSLLQVNKMVIKPKRRKGKEGEPKWVTLPNEFWNVVESYDAY